METTITDGAPVDPVKEFLRNNGKKGAEVTRQKMGPDHYKKMGKKSAEARRRKKEQNGTD